MAVDVSAPQAVDELAQANGLTVQRTRSDGHSLVAAARNRQVRMVASLDGRFGFPNFQSNFDGLYTVAKTMELCARTGLTLEDAYRQLPERTYHHVQLPCPWECKGGLMRRMSEDAVDQQASFTDGVRIDTAEGWVLVLPDQYRPIAHIVAESSDAATADNLRDTYRAKVSQWLDALTATLEG